MAAAAKTKIEDGISHSHNDPVRELRIACPTVIAVLFVCALSVVAAFFLILEMDGAFEGLIKVSADPMRFAPARLNE